ncbi:hypothetical protein [Bradyrhizobium arachidis]|uniref:hypothetical protein n=1 Tax=Bradyrhizobium arachidis TaxID=858423 RepID=UPI001160351D|nr:hypothetical protein [Bradyrhizobium arachidis]
MYRLVDMMTPAESLELAERFAWAADQAWDPISKSQLEALDKSSSVLAKSAAVLNRSSQALEIIEQRRKK